jgi:hypothetical protein
MPPGAWCAAPRPPSRADACESLPPTGPLESAALNLVLHGRVAPCG